jgi:hypothetical protein
MGTSHRLPNRYRANGYANRYPSNSPINRNSMVTNNRNSTGNVPSRSILGPPQYTTEIYVEDD